MGLPGPLILVPAHLVKTMILQTLVSTFFIVSTIVTLNVNRIEGTVFNVLYNI